MNDLLKGNAQLPTSLRVRVIPKAKMARIKMEVLADGSILYRVYVTVVAENGKANKAVVKLLAKDLSLPQSALKITHGLTSKDKIIKIER